MPRKPPASGKFKKGKSGNPKGRPKGSKNLESLLKVELKRKITLRDENGQAKKISVGEAIIKRLVQRAASGEPKSLQLIVNMSKAWTKDDDFSDGYTFTMSFDKPWEKNGKNEDDDGSPDRAAV